jgi:hypothetical protein
VAGGAVVVALALVALDATAPSSAFAWVVPHRPPAGWARLTTSDGGASLSIPPGFRRVRSDAGAVSAAFGPGPAYTAYLNVTPRQGGERPSSFAGFRVNLLGEDDDRSVHKIASSTGLRFTGGTGSAVEDTYVTRVGGHRYIEFAVLVTGHRRTWVVVATSLTRDAAREQPLLQRAVESFTTT